MALICEECGKIYHLDPIKLGRKMVGDEARAKCRECGHVMRITRSDVGPVEAGVEEAPVFSNEESGDLSLLVGDKGQDSLPESDALSAFEEPQSDIPAANAPSTRQSIFGLRTKMTLLFVLLPLLIMGGAGYLSQAQLRQLATGITQSSLGVVRELAEEIIAEKARAVAVQTRIYLYAHPELGKEDFNFDPQFRKIAVQKVGMRGYTLLFEQPAANADNMAFRIWTHPDSRLVGLPVLDTLKQKMGADYPKFARIFDRIKLGKELRGYYKWKEKDGSVSEKFMVCSPVEGTRYFVISAAYIDDFTSRLDVLSSTAKDLSDTSRKTTAAILLGALVLLGLSISIYGYRISRNLRELTEAADRISIGDLDAEIPVRTKDEIGMLAEAISRMQDSLRLSIERLRRRR